jgi:hypothetical protein
VETATSRGFWGRHNFDEQVLLCKHLAREQVWFQQRCDPNPNLTEHGNR